MPGKKDKLGKGNEGYVDSNSGYHHGNDPYSIPRLKVSKTAPTTIATAPPSHHSYDNYAYEQSSELQQPTYYDINNPGFHHGGGSGNGSFQNVGGRYNEHQIYPSPGPYFNSNNKADDVDDEDEENNGPTQKKRKCRDVICLGFLTASIILMLGVGVYAISKGSINRIIHMTDSSNCDECGIKNNPINNIPNSGQDKSKFPYVIFLNKNGSYDKSIRYFLPNNEKDMDYISQCTSTCPLEFKTIANRCVPNELRLITTKDGGVINDVSTFFSEVASDFEKSWIDVIWMCAIALGIALIMSILLRLFAGIIIWVVVIGTSLASIAGSIVLWIVWKTNKNKFDNNEDGALSKSEITGLLIAAICVSIITILLLLVFLFMRKRIALVIRLFNEAGKAIHAMPFILFQPLVTFGSLAIALSCWLIILMLIESGGDPQMVPIGIGGVDSVCIFKKNGFLNFSRWWNLLMIFWITQFIVGCQHLIIAGAVSIWFFTRNKNQLGFPILLSLKRLLRYHLGSIAFGSLIIAIVKMIRYILNTIQNRLGGNNCLCRGLLCCCKCFIWCLENFLIFLNRNAYIEIAIHGYGFCKSARKAFKVLVDNALRVSAINSIGDFVLFLAKITIVATTILIGYYMTKNKDDINHIWIPLTIGGICSYFIAHCFISVYEMAIDTVFICFCEDCDMNDGLAKPYYMSKKLMEFVKNSEKLLKKKKDGKKDRSNSNQ